MLARTRRLRRPAEINRVYKRGQLAGSHHLSIKALNTGRPESRVAIVVSRKISKKAVDRNRYRRQIAGVLEGIWQTITPGYDIVINVKTDLSALSATQLSAAIGRGLQQSGATGPKRHV